MKDRLVETRVFAVKCAPFELPLKSLSELISAIRSCSVLINEEPKPVDILADDFPGSEESFELALYCDFENVKEPPAGGSSPRVRLSYKIA